MADALGVAGDLGPVADRIARKAWRAHGRGTGMRLTALEVIALHEIEGDGEWWQSFNPAARTSVSGEQ